MGSFAARVSPITSSGNVTLGPVTCQPLCGKQMKGFGLLHLIETAKARSGADAMAGWAERLPPSVQPFVKPGALTSVGWVPVELYYSAVEHVIATHHPADRTQAIDLGHAVASRDIGAFFRAAMRFTNPPMILSLTARFWRGYYDFGSLETVHKTATSADVELRDWPVHSELAFLELAGSFVAWLEASKANDVRITRFDVASPTLVSMRVEWR
jgi:hypothetical protein